jgi:hypothetical protein
MMVQLFRLIGIYSNEKINVASLACDVLSPFATVRK